jgi:Na+/H+-dicarboxylate symporter
VTSASRLAARIFGAISLGVAFGELFHLKCPTPERAQEVADYLSLVSDTFLRLIRMIVAPLVFSTLASGVAAIGSGPGVARIGVRTLTWFIGAGLVSLVIGLCMANVLHPGTAMRLPLGDAETALMVNHGDFSVRAFLLHAVPVSLFDAMSTNSILQIVVFALFMGVAISGVGEPAAPLVRGLDATVIVMLRITSYVIRAAPIAAFAALAAVVTTRGVTVLLTFGKLLGGFYVALLILWMVIGAVAYFVLGKQALSLFRCIREPTLVAFATASSEAALAQTLEQLQRIGLPRRIVGFVVPMGFSFNTCGSMMYCAFAVAFLAQAYGIAQTLEQQVATLLVLMLASKGLAGVPRASLIVVAAALPQLGLPTAGIALLLGVDQLLDMGRTATNIVGNAVATAVIAKGEGIGIDDSD